MKTSILWLTLGFFIAIFVFVGSTFGYISFENLKATLKMEGIEIAVNTIIKTVQKDGSVTLYQTDKDGKKYPFKLNLEKSGTQEVK